MVSQRVYFLAPCLLRKFSRAGFMMAIIRGQRSTKLRDPRSRQFLAVSEVKRTPSKPEFLLGIGLSIFQ